MASSKSIVRKRLTKNIKTRLKILIVCEGLTESTYIEDLLGDVSNVEIVSIDGAGYGKFKNYIESNEKLYTIFLSNPDIEYWIACSIGQESHTKDDLESMGYRKGEYVATFLRAHNGKFNIAAQLANSNNVYYRKAEPGANYTLKREYLELRQSNLTDFLTYIQMLNQ